MTESRAFRREQRAVALGMAAALATTVIALGLAAATDRTATPLPMADRIQSAIRADIFVLAWLAAAIANVAALRFFSERDIGGSASGTESAAVARGRAILQNTLEQVVLAIAAHMIVAATFDRPETLLQTLVGLFAAGRLFFWAGYRHGAKARAFGFALTFYPSIAALLVAAIAMLTGQAA